LDAEQANIAAQNQEYDQRLKNFNAQDRAQYWQTLNANRAAQEQQRLQGIAPGSEAPDDPNNPLGTWSARTIGGQKIAVQAPDRFTKSPAGISAQREADVKRLGLKGDEAKYYRANGKLKEPTATTNVHIPSAESQEYNDWKKQFTQETGHAPTAADTQTYRHGGAGKGTKVRMGTPAQFSQLDKDTQAQYTKAEADYRVAAANAQTDEERAAALADLNVSKTKIGADHSDRLRDLGGIPAEDSQRSGGNAAPAPAAPPSQPAPKPAASAPAAQAPPQTAPQTAKVGNKTLKVGDPVQLPDGSQGIVTGINPQTGKPIVKRK
jgi:hypothetical protein